MRGPTIADLHRETGRVDVSRLHAQPEVERPWYLAESILVGIIQLSGKALDAHQLAQDGGF
ncbi:hypothetical protein [Mycolicibacter kumamotonensis]|uniref:Uncharacterized protein n=1 Tax=Mycolicibacter kumamotonensis TaxID=354243 RepID=A0A1B8SCQ1_9MYCO|nr:hypothetical protein [Mycolicibacter kumamotonensis]OBY30509.1 hypothetical protein ACT18_17380 [Mycolicibacter kumamotonensis]